MVRAGRAPRSTSTKSARVCEARRPRSPVRAVPAARAATPAEAVAVASSPPPPTIRGPRRPVAAMRPQAVAIRGLAAEHRAALPTSRRSNTFIQTIPATVAGLRYEEHHNGEASDTQAEEEAESSARGRRQLHRLQRHRAAAQVHLRPRQDPRSPGDRCLRPGAAQDRDGDQERTRDGAAAVHLVHPLSAEETTMKLILTHEVANLGAPGDIVEVKDGYGRNYLMPRGYAIRWTRGAEKQIESIKKARKVREVRDIAHAEDIRDQIEAVTVKVRERVGQGGRLFGAVTVSEIAEALNDQAGIDVDKRRIAIGNPIKATGGHTVTVSIHPEVSARLALDVAAAN